jgi:hypothetical protein
MSGSISPQAFPVAGGVGNGSGISTPGAGGGIFPHGIMATPDQQLSVADQLAAVGIPLGDNAKTNVTPPPMGEQTTTTSSGGKSGIGSSVLGAVGAIAGSVIAPGVGTAIGGALGSAVGSQI